MSFDARETSDYQGEPQELYWFVSGSTEWTYTSGSYPITFEFKTFAPLAGLSRGEVKRGRERSRNQLTVEMPRDASVVEQFFGVPDQTPIYLYIYRIHEGETDYRIMWQGRVRSTDFKGEKATMTLDDIMASTHKNGLRQLFQAQCNNFTFDANCTLDEEDFSYANQTVLTVVGDTLTIDNVEAAGWFIKGQVKRHNGERRMVMDNTKSGSTHTLTLLQPFEGLDAGEEVTLIGGACRNTLATCRDVKTKAGGTTDNSENYGGYPLIPRKNPFKSVI